MSITSWHQEASGALTSTDAVLVIAAVVRSLVLEPPWGAPDLTIYFACLVLILLRDWIFPAADIRVEPRRPQVSAPGGWPPDCGADAPPPTAEQ